MSEKVWKLGASTENTWLALKRQKYWAVLSAHSISWYPEFITHIYIYLFLNITFPKAAVMSPKCSFISPLLKVVPVLQLYLYPVCPLKFLFIHSLFPFALFLLFDACLQPRTTQNSQRKLKLILFVVCFCTRIPKYILPVVISADCILPQRWN